MYDPSDFRELKVKDRFNVGTQETVRLHTSQDVVVYAERLGVQAIVARGSLNAFQVPPHTVIWYEGPKETLGYVSDPIPDDSPKWVPARTESFTNMDKRPVVSGAMAAVTGASRLLKLQQRQMLAEIRQAQAELKKAGSVLSESVQGDDSGPDKPDPEEIGTEPDPKRADRDPAQGEKPAKKVG